MMPINWKRDSFKQLCVRLKDGARREPFATRHEGKAPDRTLYTQKILNAVKHSLVVFILLIASTSTSVAVNIVYSTDQATTGTIGDYTAASGNTTLVSNLARPRGLAIDYLNSRIYYAQHSGIIAYTDFAGTSTTTIIASGAGDGSRGMAIDTSAGFLYWAAFQDGTINRATLSGGSQTTLISGLNVPADVSIDTVNSKLYWYEAGSSTISRSDLDGTNIQTVLSSVIINGGYIAVDPINSYLFFADEDAFGNNSIKQTDLDGNNSTTLATISTTSPEGITVDPFSQTVYFASSSDQTISSVSYTGGTVSTVTGGLSNIHDIALKIAPSYFWDDTSTDGLWNTATNWLGDTVPITGANVFFENDYGTGSESVDVNINPTVQSITIDNPTAYTLNNGTITISNGGIFVDDTNGTPGSPITHTINSAITLDNSATIDNMTTGANTNLAINGNISMGGNDLTVNSDGGGIEIGGSSVISGSGNITKTGTGRLTLSSSSSNTYTGITTISGGILDIESQTALGSTSAGTVINSGGTLEINAPIGAIGESSYTISGTGSSGQGAIVLTSGTSTFLSGNVQLNADATISSESGFLLLNGNTNLGSHNLTINTDGFGASLSFGNSNVISGTGGIIKTGGGSAAYRQSGSSHNTYTGLTEVQGGNLSTSTSVDGITLIPGDIKITGGTLALLHDDNVADTSKIEMAGGTLRIQAGGAGSTTVSDTLDTLTLTENSTIGFNHVGVSGPGTIVLSFADSSAETWTSGKTLTIQNWTGTIGAGGGDDQIFFGNNASGLTSAQLSQITFNAVNGVAGTYAAKILSTGEVVPFVPVPEPSTIITGGLALLFIGYWERKRLLKLWKWVHAKWLSCVS